MFTSLVDFFDTVGTALQGLWDIMANAVEAASFFPRLISHASTLMFQGIDMLPTGYGAIISFAAVGVLAFRCLRL